MRQRPKIACQYGEMAACHIKIQLSKSRAITYKVETVHPPSKHNAFTQCCFNVTHWNSIEWMHRVCRGGWGGLSEVIIWQLSPLVIGPAQRAVVQKSRTWLDSPGAAARRSVNVGTMLGHRWRHGPTLCQHWLNVSLPGAATATTGRAEQKTSHHLLVKPITFTTIKTPCPVLCTH